MHKISIMYEKIRKAIQIFQNVMNLSARSKPVIEVTKAPISFLSLLSNSKLAYYGDT